MTPYFSPLPYHIIHHKMSIIIVAKWFFADSITANYIQSGILHFSFLFPRKYAALTKLMSEDHNWSQYRMELQSKLDSNIPCIPFLGVLLTSIVQQGSAHTVKYRGRRYSGVEDYTIMEAITVRNR